MVIAHQAILVAKSNPDTSVASFVEEKNGRLEDSQGRNGAIGPETQNFLSGAKPHASVPRLQEKLPNRFPPVSGVSFQFCAGKTCYAPRSVDPHVTFSIVADGADGPARQAVVFGIGGGNTIIQPDETAVHSADPQHSGAGLVQRQNIRSLPKPGVSAESKTVKRSPSKCASPPKVPIQR